MSITTYSSNDSFEGVPSSQKSNNQSSQTHSKVNPMEEDYYSSLSHICTEMCSKYAPESRPETYHICAYFNKDKLIMGENSPRKRSGCPISTHAEMDVLRKIYKNSLVPTNSNKKGDKYDVLVIRITKTGKLGSSRPCYHCINSMMTTSLVKIQYVYYSTNDGKIVREKLDTMLESELTIVSTGWRVRTKRSNGNSSGYSSDDSTDSTTSTTSAKSNTSSESFKSKDTSPKTTSKKMFPVIDPSTGERKMVSETEYHKNVSRLQKKSS